MAYEIFRNYANRALSGQGPVSRFGQAMLGLKRQDMADEQAKQMFELKIKELNDRMQNTGLREQEVGLRRRDIGLRERDSINKPLQAEAEIIMRSMDDPASAAEYASIRRANSVGIGRKPNRAMGAGPVSEMAGAMDAYVNPFELVANPLAGLLAANAEAPRLGREAMGRRIGEANTKNKNAQAERVYAQGLIDQGKANIKKTQQTAFEREFDLRLKLSDSKAIKALKLKIAQAISKDEDPAPLIQLLKDEQAQQAASVNMSTIDRDEAEEELLDLHWPNTSTSAE